MQKEIRYTGMDNFKSPYDAVDGTLDVAYNVVNECGSLEPVHSGTPILTTGGEALCIHEGVGFSNIIYWDERYDRLYSVPKEGGSPATVGDIDTKPIQVTPVSNTIVVLTEENKEFFLWTTRDNEEGESVTGYHYLGSKVDFLSMSFALESEIKWTDNFHVGVDTHNKDVYELTDEESVAATSSIMGQVSKTIYDEHDNDRFVFPFFIRYALRLYDGTLVNHSSPILMSASGDCPFMAKYIGYDSDGDIAKLGWYSSSLVHNIVATSDFASKWKDVVSSVDVFISAPLYTIDMSGKVKSFNKYTDYNTGRTDLSGIYSIGRYNKSGHYTKRTFWEDANFGTSVSAYTHYNLPKPDENTIGETGEFYLLRSIPITDNELNSSGYKELGCGKKLNVIRTQELMVDDYRSTEEVKGSMFVYNKRLHLYNVQRKVNNYLTIQNALEHTSCEYKYSSTITIFVNEYGNEYVVSKTINNQDVDTNTGIRYFFFPNTRAYKAEIRITRPLTDPKLFVLNLTPHTKLNGAFWYDNGEPATEVTFTNKEPDVNDWISENNKMYVSSVSSPYSFPLSGIVSIGVGNIIGMSAATKEMSQGQYGQYPLYVFTDDGIYAMSVSETGLYETTSAFAHDIALKNSITSIDSTVVFATKRGIFILNGQNPVCISESLVGKPSVPTCLSQLVTMTFENFSSYLYKEWEHNNETFSSSVRMAQDYIRQRIIVYNPCYSYSYIYSQKTGLWTMIGNSYYSTLTSYPECLVNSKDSKVVNISKDSSTSSNVSGFVISRPMSLGDDTLKSMIDSIHRGVFDVGDVKVVLEGTRNYKDWFVMASSSTNRISRRSGTPYKAFRFSVLFTMTSGESLAGVACSIERRRTNRLR